jgi:hypothetical protein
MAQFLKHNILLRQNFLGMRILITICSLFVFTLFTLNGQVTSVSYKLKYNKKSNLYEAYLRIEKGSSDNKNLLTQYNSQMSIFTPQGAKLQIVESTLPFTTNESGEEIISSWKVSNKIENVPVVNNQTIYSINPKLSPRAYYKDLKQGHEYKVFSFSISPQPKCTDLVRLYDNINDHINISVNYKGGNFKNAYSMGGIKQLYDDKSKPNNVHEMSEIVLTPLKESYDEGETVEILIENKNEEYQYGLRSKNSKKVMNDMVFKEIKPELSGNYEVFATNGLGCNVEKEFSLVVKPQAVTEVAKPIVDKVSIYPNPVKDNLNLNVSTKDASKIVADVYDQSGKRVMKNILNEKNSIGEVKKSIPLNLSSGLYLVKLSINGVETHHPFIVVE